MFSIHIFVSLIAVSSPVFGYDEGAAEDSLAYSKYNLNVRMTVFEGFVPADLETPAIQPLSKMSVAVEGVMIGP